MQLFRSGLGLFVLIVVILGLTACGGGGSADTTSSGNESVTYDIFVGASPSSCGTVSGSGRYSAGQTVVLTASPNPECTFINWTEGGTVVSVSAIYSFTASTNITLAANFEALPIANAGVDFTVTPGSVVTLDGSKSSYFGTGSLTYSWSFSSRPYGSAASLSGASELAPSFVADLHGVYTLVLSVSDGAQTFTDSVQISATPEIKTQVNGIITENTIWTTENSPYQVTDRVQIAEAATLTIEPGVSVYGGNNCPGAHCEIEVFGGLTAIGTPEANIGLHRLDILPGRGSTKALNVSYAKMQYTSLLVTSLKNSVIAGAWVQPKRCDSGCSVSGNVIIGGPVIASGSVQIINNTFYNYHVGFASSAYAIEAYDQSNVIKGNTFASTDRLAVLVGGYEDIDLTGNYWGTTSQQTIGQMIFDRNDDLNVEGFGYYDPFLLERDPSTPAIEPYLQ